MAIVMKKFVAYLVVYMLHFPTEQLQGKKYSKSKIKINKIQTIK